MAALARLRLHEELGRDGGTIAGLRRTRKEWPVHSVAFLRLRPRRHVRILDAVRAAPTHFPHSPSRAGYRHHGDKEGGETERPTSHSGREQNNHAERGETDVRIQKRSEWTRCPC